MEHLIFIRKDLVISNVLILIGESSVCLMKLNKSHYHPNQPKQWHLKASLTDYAKCSKFDSKLSKCLYKPQAGFNS